MIPDVDLDHLALVVTRLPAYGRNQNIESLVAHLVETSGYPRAERPKGKEWAVAEGSLSSVSAKRKAGIKVTGLRVNLRWSFVHSSLYLVLSVSFSYLTSDSSSLFGSLDFLFLLQCPGVLLHVFFIRRFPSVHVNPLPPFRSTLRFRHIALRRAKSWRDSLTLRIYQVRWVQQHDLPKLLYTFMVRL